MTSVTQSVSQASDSQYPLLGVNIKMNFNKDKKEILGILNDLLLGSNDVHSERNDHIVKGKALHGN